MSTRMDGEPHSPSCDDHLSLQDAAKLYEVPYRTLGNRVRYGEIDAHKARGRWGYEWRVSPQALEAFGYQPRRVLAACGDPVQDPPDDCAEDGLRVR